MLHVHSYNTVARTRNGNSVARLWRSYEREESGAGIREDECELYPLMTADGSIPFTTNDDCAVDEGGAQVCRFPATAHALNSLTIAQLQQLFVSTHPEPKTTWRLLSCFRVLSLTSRVEHMLCIYVWTGVKV